MTRKGDKVKKGSKKGFSTEGAFVTSDPRFSQVYNDPRFRAPRKKDLKIKLDDRFTKEELSFGKSSAKVDKYGRKISGKDDEEQKDVFDKLYETTKEDEDEDEGESEAEADVMARARGLMSEEESSESSSSESEDEDEEVVFNEKQEDEDVFGEIQEDGEVPEGEPTTRLAAVNLDWDHITSTDLFATFSGFIQKGGKLIKVSIYPSDYGKMKMQKEEVEGPPKEFFGAIETNEGAESDSGENDDEDGEIDIQKATKKLYTEDEGIDYNSKALRKYQLQRLRYYYAVINCDSVETAKSIYENCDETEYESTANTFDLRYIPEDMEFTDSVPRDTCDRVPSSYKPIDFATDALRNSKVKLSWDETPIQRIEMTSRDFSQREIDDMDFKAYLASDSSEEEAEEDAEKTKERYRRLLKKPEPDEEDDEDGISDVDMEVTFTPGLIEADKEVKEEKEESKQQTTIEKYRNKEKDRKKKRKEKLKEMKKQERAKKTGKREKHRHIEEKKDDNHFDMKDIIKAEKLKLKKKKSKKQKRQEREIGEIDEDIKIDEGDTRFDEIFEDHEFAIDPTNPEFKKTTVMKKLEERKNPSSQDHAVWIDESKCFFEDLPKDTIVVGKYEAYEFDANKNDYVNSNRLQVEITVDETFDNNHRVVSQKNSPIGQFTFTSLDSGEHKFCITPKHTDWSKRAKHRILFDLAVGDARPLVDSRRDEDVNFLTMKTNELVRKIQDIRREQQLFRVKEAIFRDTSESVNYNSVKWTGVQLIVLVAIGVWQTSYLKSYFVKQKVV
ncbi:hypothetical protein FOA43_002582 [Brettanomyces nanus]|uniref:GOLD domain-containing protein n=1 Tax=Eeniella nana TaxID=13502 RepID=A0A875S5B6_EENNA|nr:uncharacterized protein FOA43_002582 [Brettanomyces nanus]QPG75232.1 hypothetical protein FOA43_002582 [Brettanomyces nanus]